MTMNEMQIGQTGYVKDIIMSNSMRKKLQEVGLINGTHVRCVLKSPFSDPVAFMIRGVLIALRIEDICQIVIEECVEE